MKKYVKVSASSCVDMINAFNTRLMELDPTQIDGSVSNDCDKKEVVEGAEGDYSDYNDITEDSVREDFGLNDQYIQDLMSYIADETASDEANPRVCTWRTENDNIIFVLTGIEDEYIEEFTCPISDLTGDIDQDSSYIIDATKEE